MDSPPAEKKYFQHKGILIPFLVSLLLNLLQWGLILWQLMPLRESLILHYTIYFGIDMHGPAWQAFYIPAIGLVIIIVNTLLARKFRVYALRPYILLYAALIIQILLAVMTLLLVLINI